jgi:hypothetical protein
VWGGPTANAYFDFGLGGDRPRIGYGYVTHTQPIDPYSARLWPGFAIGLQL